MEHLFEQKISVTALMSAFETDYKSDFYFKGEYHDFWEAVYVISGRAGISADGRVYELSEGELILHKPMEFHKLWAVGKENLHLLIFSFAAEGVGLKELEGFVARLSYSQEELAEKILSCLRQGIKYEFNKWGQLNYLQNVSEGNALGQVLKNYIELFLIDLCEETVKEKEHSDTRGAEIYMQLVRIMKDGIYEWLSVDEIASRCSFSASYIKKVFKKYASCGIHEYFIKMKIKKAVSLMEDGYSVRAVSEKLSFSNENYFNTVFKRETGLPPGKYIKRG